LLILHDIGKSGTFLSGRGWGTSYEEPPLEKGPFSGWEYKEE